MIPRRGFPQYSTTDSLGYAFFLVGLPFLAFSLISLE
jgi:hypothetical protein